MIAAVPAVAPPLPLWALLALLSLFALGPGHHVSDQRGLDPEFGGPFPAPGVRFQSMKSCRRCRVSIISRATRPAASRYG
jgi:hypothetical protein